jgi:hypothetical protein
LPVVTLSNPANNANTTSLSNVFDASVSDNIGLSNATLYVWNLSNGVLIGTSFVSLSGTSGTASASFTLPETGNVSYKWNYLVRDWNNNMAWASANRTLNYKNVSIASSGWTTFTPSSDTRIVYVSATGNDGACTYYAPNSPLVGSDPFHPVGNVLPCRTVGGAQGLIRNGYPDWILLKKGDSWSDSIGWSYSGRSGTEPILLGAYGTGARPVINSGGNDGVSIYSPVSNLAIVGISFISSLRQSNTGFWILADSGQNILLEDLYIKSYGVGVSVQATGGGYNVNNFIRNLTIKRSVIVDSKSASGHSQGIYTAGVRGVNIIESVIDHSGWINVNEMNIFDHNIYLDAEGGINATIRGNILTRASATGAQIRFDGTIENNLFVQNPIGFFIRSGVDENDQTGGAYGTYVSPFTEPSVVRDNVVLDGIDIGNIVDGARAFGFEILDIRTSVVATNNIVSHDNSNWPYGKGINIQSGALTARNVLISNNIVYDWRNSIYSYNAPVGNNYTISNNQLQLMRTDTPIFVIDSGSSAGNGITYVNNQYYSPLSQSSWFQIGGSLYNLAGWVTRSGETGAQAIQVSYPDPNRDVGSYHASIGGAATFDAFIAGARAQSKDNWDPRYTAAAVNSYIRAGFGR